MDILNRDLFWKLHFPIKMWNMPILVFDNVILVWVYASDGVFNLAMY